MIDCGSLPYATARLAARHGQRLDAAAWQRIEGLRDLAAALEAARRTALRPWLLGLTAELPPAELEAALRAQARAAVDEVAAWVGPDWRAAVQWCALLPDLAPLQHLLRGGAPPAWMRADARWQAVAEAEPAARQAALADTPWAALATQAPEHIATAWADGWRRRCPRAALADGTLAGLATLLRAQAGAFVQAGPGSGRALREQLQHRLRPWLRGAMLEPAGVFAQLVLTALDLERLRGELLRRAWFPQGLAPGGRAEGEG